MISEEEFRELQEELDDLTESLGRLEEMNEALSEVVFTLLQSTSIRPRLFSRLIDHTLDKWLILRRDLGSPSAKLLQRVRDDVLCKPPEGTLDFPSARPRPLLRAVPAPRRKDWLTGRTVLEETFSVSLGLAILLSLHQGQLLTNPATNSVPNWTSNKLDHQIPPIKSLEFTCLPARFLAGPLRLPSRRAGASRP
ncbi:hypothetical protein ACNUIP_32090 [Pseudomonas aeruginosa]